MGFFSYVCTKCNQPVLADALGVGLANRVMVFDRNGLTLDGSYDGYGRIAGKCFYEFLGRAMETEMTRGEFISAHCEEMENLGDEYQEADPTFPVKMIHSGCQSAGDNYETLKPSESDSGQGFFYSDKQVDGINRKIRKYQEAK